MKLFEKILKLNAFAEIIGSPLIIGLVIGFIIYKKLNNLMGLIIGIVVATISLVIGIIIALRINKKRDIVELVSRVSASPDLDNLEDEIL